MLGTEHRDSRPRCHPDDSDDPADSDDPDDPDVPGKLVNYAF